MRLAFVFCLLPSAFCLLPSACPAFADGQTYFQALLSGFPYQSFYSGLFIQGSLFRALYSGFFFQVLSRLCPGLLDDDVEPIPQTKPGVSDLLSSPGSVADEPVCLHEFTSSPCHLGRLSWSLASFLKLSSRLSSLASRACRVFHTDRRTGLHVGPQRFLE